MNTELPMSREVQKLFGLRTWYALNSYAAYNTTEDGYVVEPDKRPYFCKPFNWSYDQRCHAADEGEKVFELAYPYIRVGWPARHGLPSGSIYMASMYIEFSGDGERWMPAQIPHVYTGKPAPCGLSVHPEARAAKNYLDMWDVFQSGVITYVERTVQGFWKDLWDTAPKQDTKHRSDECNDYRCVIHNATLMEQFSVDDVCEYLNEVYEKHEIGKFYTPMQTHEAVAQTGAV